MCPVVRKGMVITVKKFKRLLCIFLIAGLVPVFSSAVFAQKKGEHESRLAEELKIFD